VRLRVTDLSVTGTDSGTLRAGSEVRVRLATTAAATATSTATAAGPEAPLPDRLDVRIRLDDAAIEALESTAGDRSGPTALKALVDLVGGTTAADAYAVRVRMALTPASATRAAVGDEARAADGASNVVSVVTPIGVTTPSEPDDPDPASPAPDPTTTEPVEVRVPLPTSATTTPDDGAVVPVPIPTDAATPPPAGAPTTADAAVVIHLPTAGEPIGGTPEDLDLSLVPMTPDPSAADPSAAAPDASAADPSATETSAAAPDASAAAPDPPATTPESSTAP
jgi:hypothetical protein